MIRYILDRVHLYKFKKADKQRSIEILLIQKLWDNLSKMGNSKYDKLLNVCLYSSLTNRDIYYLAENYYFQKNLTRKNFFGRLLCMSIIEFLDDMNNLLGKNFLTELENNDMEVFINPIKQLNKAYSDLKKNYNKDLREIRNNAAAHKNKDAKYLVKFYTLLPVNNLTEIGYNIGKLEFHFQFITNLVVTELSFQLREDKIKKNDNQEIV